MKQLRVLAVNPRFAPVNAADSHRLRLLLPYAAACGWQVEVLAVSPDDVDGNHDEWLEQQLPKSVVVHRVRTSQWASRLVNSLALRSLKALCVRGDELLSSGRFDLVFFSTTEFLVTLLGIRWRERFGVPFCVDFQDPWVNNYYELNPAVPKPGGPFKYALAQLVDGWAERRVVAACDGFMAVSEVYISDLSQRYDTSVTGKPALVRGFPGEPAEFDGITATDSAIHSHMIWRYIGRGGEIFAKTVGAFFAAWQQACDNDAEVASNVHFEALGTSYASAERAWPTLAPLAAGTRLEAKVTEQTDRLAYSQVLVKLRESDALIVFGSNDPGYTASKLYSCLLARRPLLAILHRQSPAVPFLQAVGGAVCVTFDADTSDAGLVAAIYQQWFAEKQYTKLLPLDVSAFEPFTAAAQARDVAGWFERIVDSYKRREGRG